jgi:hypothetical protein
MSHNIEVESGKQVKLPTAGKYCDRDIVVRGTGSDPADLQAKYDEGKKAEYDAFWDMFQNNGEEQNYINAFSYGRFNEQTYNPKYPIKVLASSAGMNQAFYSCGLTDTKVPIYASALTRLSQTFENSTTLVTIPLLQISADCTFYNAFRTCNALENITIDGEIGQDGLSFQWSRNLSKASITSIISHLSTTTSGMTLTLSKTAVNKAFETSEGANDGSSSPEGTALVQTRPNWTIVLA